MPPVGQSLIFISLKKNFDQSIAEEEMRKRGVGDEEDQMTTLIYCFYVPGCDLVAQRD